MLQQNKNELGSYELIVNSHKTDRKKERYSDRQKERTNVRQTDKDI